VSLTIGELRQRAAQQNLKCRVPTSGVVRTPSISSSTQLLVFHQRGAIMQRNPVHTAILAAGLILFSIASASAQQDVVKNLSRTDVSGSLYGAFSGTTTGDGVVQSPSNSAGVLLGVRHIVNPIIGYEGTYSYNRADQTYKYSSPLSCTSAPCIPAAVAASAHEVTGDWVVSFKIANVRPFALAGGGLLFNQPSSGQANATSSAKGVFVYGAGLDWGLIPHLGLRFQYRGNLYQAPDLSRLYTSSNAFTHTAEPMIGAYLRF
jgi:Outer membrane protein beta-barrel domain